MTAPQSTGQFNTTEAPRPAGESYYVYGSYGYTNEQLYYEGPDYAQAQRAFDHVTDDPEDMDGHEVVEIASFASDGEFLTHQTRRTQSA
jgi:hypothetical protein